MGIYDDFSHSYNKGPLAGNGPFDVFNISGENIAAYYPCNTPQLTTAQAKAMGEKLFNLWLNSEGHRNNFMNSYHTQLEVGVAVVVRNGTPYAYGTQHFLAPYMNFPIASSGNLQEAIMTTHDNIYPDSGNSGSALGNVITMRLNNTKAILDGQTVAVDKNNSSVYPFTLGTKTVVPVRFVERLGAKVNYTSDTKPIVITYKKIKLEINVGSK
jgi:hypothetical protein